MSEDSPLYQNFPLRIFNSLGRKKQEFSPVTPGRVGMYVCGPTVYNEVHLGNVRTFLTFDIVYRYLQYLGYKVRYVRNITDVGHLTDDADDGEDKIEKRARLEQLEPMELVQKYTNGFHATTLLFNLCNPDIEPTATGHLQEQMEMVQRIIDNGYGYTVNGSVYFDVRKFNEKYAYGKLSGRKLDELLEQTRENLEGGDEKRYFADFAIWKAASDNTIMKWNSPWGKGVPGWHLECSAMSTKYLGETFDIHGGGMDLLFPHHECEIAQSVGAEGTEPVRYWMHGNMLTVNGTKMSKSLGNSFTPQQLITGDHLLLEQGYSPMTVRFFFLMAHYRSTVDFSNDALKAAEKGYKRLMDALKTAKKLPLNYFSVDDTAADAVLKKKLDEVRVELSDDFNTAKAIALLFDIGSLFNALYNKQEQYENYSQSAIVRAIGEFDKIIVNVLGLLPEPEDKHLLTDAVMHVLIALRNEARIKKDWALSDRIRDLLAEKGILLKDGKDGTSYVLQN
jgi:cysteinyl-tRNA synthetase